MSETTAPPPREDVLALLLRDGPAPDARSGVPVIEVHHVWRDVLVDTCHLPQDAPVTLGDEVGSLWSVLGVPLGWVDPAWAGPLRFSPPLLAEVRTTWKTDLHVPAELLSGGASFLLVEQEDGPVLRVPPGADAFLDEGGRRFALADLLASGRARQEGEVVRLPLAKEARVAVGLGEHVVVVRRTDRGARVGVRRPDGGDLALVASLLLCLGGIGLMALVGLSQPRPPVLDVVELPRPPVTLVVQPPDPLPEPVRERRPSAGGPKAPGPEGAVGRRDGTLRDARGTPRPGRADDRRVAGGAGIFSDRGVWELVGSLDGGLADAVGGLSGPKGAAIGEGGLGKRGAFRGGGGGPESLGSWGPGGPGGPGGHGADPFGGPGGFSKKGLGTPTAAPREPIVEGSLEPSLIDAVVKRRLASIRHCYQRVLQTQPDLAGKVVVAFTIARDGSVSAAGLAEDGLGSRAVKSCLTATFFTLRFPEPKGGGVVDVRYPFVFAPG